LFVFLILKGSIPVKQICKSEFPYYSHLNCWRFCWWRNLHVIVFFTGESLHFVSCWQWN
jgi:hypothetical protein